MCSVVFLSCSTRNETAYFTKQKVSNGVRLVLPVLSQKKLQKKRTVALNRGHILKSEKQYVPAELVVDIKSTAIKIRLKGDEIDHLNSNKWSYRIKSKNTLIADHRRFSLQNPGSKNFLSEYLFHAFCKKEGLLALDYFFVPFSINDSLSKVYAYESVVDNNTLKQGGRKIGPILKFDENAYWKKFGTTTEKIDSVSMLSAKIKSCNKKWCKKNPKIVEEGTALLTAYRAGNLRPEQAFDYDLFAKYVAISEVLGSSHNFRWINLRLYYNSTSKKLEPVAFDCFDGDHPRTTLIWYQERKKFEYFLHPLFADQKFINLVEKQLKIYTQITYLKELLHENHSALMQYNQLLKKENPSYFFNREELFSRAEYLQKALVE